MKSSLESIEQTNLLNCPPSIELIDSTVGNFESCHLGHLIWIIEPLGSSWVGSIRAVSEHFQCNFGAICTEIGVWKSIRIEKEGRCHEVI